MGPQINKGALLRGGALALLIAAAVAQTPLPPRLYDYHKLPTDTAWDWDSIVIEPPLLLWRDNTGQAHLGIQMFVDNEIPTRVDDGGNISYLTTVAPSPPSSLHLTVNGVEVFVSSDFNLQGQRIVFTGAAPAADATVLASYRK